MNKKIIGAVLAAFAMAACVSPGDVNQKPVDKPYAAGSPSGGVPLWKPGEKFVAIAGGACLGTCPIYELYVFDDGRVTFLGKKFTGKSGVFNKQVEKSVYGELLATILRTGVLDDSIKRGACLTGRSERAHADPEHRLRGACGSCKADRETVHRLHRSRVLDRPAEKLPLIEQ
jgi:hypothetical protein